LVPQMYISCASTYALVVLILLSWTPLTSHETPFLFTQISFRRDGPE